MRFNHCIAFLVVLACTLAAVARDTNAMRFARGLPPLPPARRHENHDSRPSSRPKHHPCHPFGRHSELFCCNHVAHPHDPQPKGLCSLLGIEPPNHGHAGVGCARLTPRQIEDGEICTTELVCCTDNRFTGILNLECEPIHLW